MLNGYFPRSKVSLTFRQMTILTAFVLGPIAKAAFSESVDVAGDRLLLHGESSFSWLFFDLYDAALYLPADVSGTEALQNVPKKLILCYKREIPAEKIIEAGNKLLQKNCLPEELEAIEAALETINRAYRTPRKDDVYALSFHPERGSTVLYFNDEALATIEGEQFANLYFRIWLGKHPVSERFRDELLKPRG